MTEDADSDPGVANSLALKGHHPRIQAFLLLARYRYIPDTYIPDTESLPTWNRYSKTITASDSESEVLVPHF